MLVADPVQHHYKGLTILSFGISITMVVCLISLVIYDFLSRPSYLDINIAPSSAVVTIGDTTYTNGSYAIEPGEYSIKISADGFEPKTLTFTVSPHQSNQLISYLLNKDEGLSYFERSTSDLSVLRLINGDSTIDQFLSNYDQKLSIRNILPINASNSESFIYIKDGSDSPSCSYAFCLLIDGPSGSESRVREIMSLNGYNLDDFEVIYE